MSTSTRRNWNLASFCLALLILGSTACAQAAPEITPTSTASYDLILYVSPTPSPSLTPPALLATIPVTPQPSATPFTHVITNDDTLLGLALKYGVKLEDILAANPGVDPHLLTVGKTLVIPIKGQDLAAIPTSTPIPVGHEDPVCYPTADRGAWCFLLVKNDGTAALENISAWVGLFSPAGENLASQVAISPLNLLPPGAAIPLTAFFPPSLPGHITPRSEILTAAGVPKKDKRYLDADLQVTGQVISQDGKQANLRGTVSMRDKKDHPASLWVVAVAYGADGEVVGVRKWDASMEPRCQVAAPTGTAGPTTTPAAPAALPNQCLSFEMTVYSLGSSIQKVDLLVEARP